MVLQGISKSTYPKHLITTTKTIGTFGTFLLAKNLTVNIVNRNWTQATLICGASGNFKSSGDFVTDFSDCSPGLLAFVTRGRKSFDV